MLGTILLIILVIALLGGFSGWGGGPVLRYRLLWWRRHRPLACHRRAVGRDRLNLTNLAMCHRLSG